MNNEHVTYMATLSHDLQIPAIAQLRALELLLSGQLGSFNNEQKELLELTLNSCRYLYNMVKTLLSAYKFESSEIVLNYDVFNINTLIKEAIDETLYMTEENLTNIYFDALEDYFICADRFAIKRVILNLLSNAINFAFPSSDIFITLKNKSNKIIFVVTNTSNYINPENMHAIFNKYVTTSTRYNKVGVGLGLYLARKIIRMHKGKIIAKSSTDNFNSFGFIIPSNSDIKKDGR